MSAKAKGGKITSAQQNILKLTVWILAAIISDGLAFLDGEIGITLTEADITFIIT